MRAISLAAFPRSLGDGRAHLLGEFLGPDGRRWDLQLKGSGRTPFSRGGDGKAALGPMLREYLISEAMAALRIPTTRSLAVVTTGENVLREDGAVARRGGGAGGGQPYPRRHVSVLSCAAERPTSCKRLLDYTIARHYPGVRRRAGAV